MSSNRKIMIGPVALTTTLTTNILNPASAGSGVGYTPTASYIILYHIHILNKTAVPATFSLWKGVSGGNAAGTEFWDIGKIVPANDSVDRALTQDSLQVGREIAQPAGIGVLSARSERCASRVS